MKRHRRLSRITPTRSRQPASELPEVPTLQPNMEEKQEEPSHATHQPDAIEEAVRRMIEAAYT
jgi:hypothetical protein